jgi:hypothetical protein
MKPTLFALLFVVSAARAQYSIDWFTMDGGGGSGSAGTFLMSGTIGQPDAASGSADGVVFLGGYWSAIAEELPILRIFRFNGKIILAWPDPSPGFILETKADLFEPKWNEVSIEPEIVGSEKQVMWGVPVDNHFFRLHRP